MLRVAIGSIFFLLVSSMAIAQAGSIGVFADPQGLSCDLDNTQGTMEVYCVHVNTPGATGCQFSVEVAGMPLTYVGETSPFDTKIGNSQTGIAIAYTVCMASPIHLLTITYSGVSLPCDMIRVVDDPNPEPPGIYTTDCSPGPPNLLIATGGAAYINNDGNCKCNVPTEQTTWGQVKALYSK